ncbi:glycosyltransferase family 2 protein [Isoptericola sp. b490]|uniref:glycosyltransferase family 2 protein n=1 Tax=Actinotalea lenta TaxID=3064654 RepID=UPI0027123E40|nr:glycosyltransferase family 2 protein [Isoptericola sp. b490]MDO8119969.1 glycosyltransferase family 2 protein [Isoptericola sp. b490]
MTSVVAVVVTFGPDLELTETLLRSLSAQVEHVVVVDNGSPDVTGLRDLCARTGVRFEPLATNTGIAAAQNVGIAAARDLAATHVLLSDQDSVPAADMVELLLAGLRAAERRGDRPGAVGPVSVDVRSADEVMVYRDSRWGPRRSPCTPDTDGLVEATFLLASGCLIPLDVLDDVGGMNEAWFIDHVDLEWGLRARRRGWTLHAVVAARLDHRLGDRLVRLPGRRQEVHVHSPTRVYYLARNTVLLVRSGLLPVPWRIGYLVWLAKLTAFNALLVPPRWRRARLAVRGVLDGLLRRTGPLRVRPGTGSP